MAKVRIVQQYFSHCFLKSISLFQNSFPYSADDKHTENKNRFDFVIESVSQTNVVDPLLGLLLKNCSHFTILCNQNLVFTTNLYDQGRNINELDRLL